MARLFIGNIPHGSSEVELQQWLHSRRFQVESVEIIRDRSTGLSRGFGFVTLAQEWRLQEAIDSLNGQRMGWRILTVNRANPVSQRSDGRLS
jgi:RNA recognition motif-containing protein